MTELEDKGQVFDSPKGPLPDVIDEIMDFVQYTQQHPEKAKDALRIMANVRPHSMRKVGLNIDTNNVFQDAITYIAKANKEAAIDFVDDTLRHKRSGNSDRLFLANIARAYPYPVFRKMSQTMCTDTSGTKDNRGLTARDLAALTIADIVENHKELAPSVISLAHDLVAKYDDCNFEYINKMIASAARNPYAAKGALDILSQEQKMESCDANRLVDIARTCSEISQYHSQYANYATASYATAIIKEGTLSDKNTDSSLKVAAVEIAKCHHYAKEDVIEIQSLVGEIDEGKKWKSGRRIANKLDQKEDQNFPVPHVEEPKAHSEPHVYYGNKMKSSGKGGIGE
jgi:hypothetical protein